jgi:serine protease inhibitor
MNLESLGSSELKTEHLRSNKNDRSWPRTAEDRLHFVQAFGMRLLQEECSRRLPKNVFISPLSLFIALSMLEKGSNAETKAAIRKTLALPADRSNNAFEIVLAELVRYLRAQPSIEFVIANALWTQMAAAISPAYAKLCADLYDAEARTVDLTQPAAAAAINAWIAEKTKGVIPQIVTPADIVAALAVITNAVYFKAQFRYPFWEELTDPQPFHLANGTDTRVQMMMRGRMSDVYWRSEKCEAAELRYSNSEVALTLVLPAKGLSPEDVLTQECLSGMCQEDERAVLFKVPRFTIDYQNALQEPLTKMGMGIAFGSAADFTSIQSQGLFISNVIHKTRLKVEEQGTIASAASALIAPATAPLDLDPIKEMVQLIFDRPFAVLLRDEKYGATLFAGVVYEP